MPDPDLILESLVFGLYVLAALSLPSLLVLGLVLDGKIPALVFRPGKPQEPPLWSLFEVIVALVLYLLLLGFVGAALLLAVDSDRARWVYLQPLNMIVAGGATLAVVWNRVGTVLGQPPSSVGAQGASWRNFAPCIVTSVAVLCPLLVLSSAWFGWLAALLDRRAVPQDPVKTFQEAISGDDTLAIVALVACGVVLAPIFEEFLFRGLLFGLLRRKWGTTAGLILSSAVFSAYHLSLSAFLPLFAIGMMLGAVYHLTRSLVFAIFWHMLFNASMMVMMVVMPGG